MIWDIQLDATQFAKVEEFKHLKVILKYLPFVSHFDGYQHWVSLFMSARNIYITEYK